MLIIKEETGSNWPISAENCVPMNTGCLLCNMVPSEMILQQKTCMLVTARWEEGYTTTLCHHPPFASTGKGIITLKWGNKDKGEQPCFTSLGQDLRPRYYTTVICRLLESANGLSKREFVIARKEEAKKPDEGSRVNIPCPCLPGHR